MLKLYVNNLKLLNSFKFSPIHATICTVYKHSEYLQFTIFHCIVLHVFHMYSKPMLSIDTVCIREFSLTALPLDLVVMRTEDSLTFRFGCDEDRRHTVGTVPQFVCTTDSEAVRCIRRQPGH